MKHYTYLEIEENDVAYLCEGEYDASDLDCFDDNDF